MPVSVCFCLSLAVSVCLWLTWCPRRMIRQQQPMTDEQAMESDELYRARFQSLLSVDDMVEVSDLCLSCPCCARFAAPCSL